MRVEGKTQLWGYHVSHSCLHLCSVKNKLRNSRIDIVFKGVSDIQLSSSIESLEIRKSEEEVSGMDNLFPSLRDVSIEGKNVYLLRGKCFMGYVVAAAMFVDESDRDYDQPGLLWEDILAGRDVSSGVVRY